VGLPSNYDQETGSPVKNKPEDRVEDEKLLLQCLAAVPGLTAGDVAAPHLWSTRKIRVQFSWCFA
jgi:hypothetical protein